MFTSLKSYIDRHRDIIFTLGLVIVIDHFVFAGTFREKIKALVESMLSKAHKQLDEASGPKA